MADYFVPSSRFWFILRTKFSILVGDQCNDASDARVDDSRCRIHVHPPPLTKLMYTYPVERLVETAKANQTFLYFAPTYVRQQQAEIIRPPTLGPRKTLQSAHWLLKTLNKLMISNYNTEH